ncbi:hypothetical protein NC652_029366 [Populus alba x Populus x berolinensis]|nr:hypothetical protein NC652_029366 [Populus alba x Populus x berolinensis]
MQVRSYKLSILISANLLLPINRGIYIIHARTMKGTRLRQIEGLANFDRFGAYKIRWSKLMASGSYLGCEFGLKTKTFTMSMGLFYHGSFI